jgi:peptidoglycan hydrolase-like protein with peptidoglycan-binding domain
MALRIGDRGSAVRSYQRQLQREGYRIRADGIYGPKTHSAHRSFKAKGDVTPGPRSADRQGGKPTPARPQTPSQLKAPWQSQAPSRPPTSGPSGRTPAPGTVQPGASRPGEPRYMELTRFAESRGFHVTSTTGGHHLGAAHREGRAADIRTKDHTRRQVDQFIREAREAGYIAHDERDGGNSAWTGAHVHLEVPSGRRR